MAATDMSESWFGVHHQASRTTKEKRMSKKVACPLFIPFLDLVDSEAKIRGNYCKNQRFSVGKVVIDDI